LIEVMVSISILTVALAAVFSYQFTLNSQRESSLSRAMRTITINNLVNLVDGTNWDELGRSQRPWSMSRVRGGGVGTLPPLTLSDLLGMGVISSETGMFNGNRSADAGLGFLRFYVEYYRSTSNMDAALNPISSQPGLMDAQHASTVDFKSDFTTRAADCRIVPDPLTGLADTTLVTPGNPILVRLIAVNVDPASNSEQVIGDTFLGTSTAPQ